MASHKKDNAINEQKQLMKTRNQQERFNKEIVNEDAFYKFLAYTGNLESKRRANVKETRKDETILAAFHSFENFY